MCSRVKLRDEFEFPHQKYPKPLHFIVIFSHQHFWLVGRISRLVEEINQLCKRQKYAKFCDLQFEV